jgi:hypothetical protein
MPLVPIDAGHLVTSDLAETEYADCGNVPLLSPRDGNIKDCAAV